VENAESEVKEHVKPAPEEKSRSQVIYVAVIAVALLIGAAFVVFFVGIAMWQLGIFNMGSTSLTATGFAKIKPQLAGTSMEADGTFTSVLTNGAGTAIKIKKIILTNKQTSSACELDFSPGEVAAGENIQVSGRGCGSGHKGDVYSVEMKIDYSLTIGGMTREHTDIGNLRGPIE